MKRGEFDYAFSFATGIVTPLAFIQTLSNALFSDLASATVVFIFVKVAPIVLSEYLRPTDPILKIRSLALGVIISVQRFSCVLLIIWHT